MRIKLTDVKNIDARKTKLANSIKPLLVALYRYIADDNRKIIKKYNGVVNKQTFIKEHKQDIKSHIKTIYRKTFNEFGYDTRKTLNKYIEQKVFTIEKTDKKTLDDTWNELTLQFINTKADEHADFILDTLYDKTEFYHKKANNNINQISTKMSNDLTFFYAQLARFNQMPISKDKTDKVNKTKRQIQNTQKKINYLRDNRNEAIADEYYDLFNDNVVKQLATLESNQEVGFAESMSRQIELAVLADAFDELDLGKKKFNLKSGFIKEWDATLDGRTRKSHARAHGQQKKVSEKFEVDNPQSGAVEYGYAPRDENFSLANKINCRCVMVIYMNIE